MRLCDQPWILQRCVERRPQRCDPIGGNARRPEIGPADFRRRQHQLQRLPVLLIGDQVTEERDIGQLRVLRQPELQKDVDLFSASQSGSLFLSVP